MDEQDEQLKQLCEQFRIAKIEMDEAKKKLDVAKKALRIFVDEQEMEKGHYYGVKVGTRYTFAKSNLKVAADNEIDIPYKDPKEDLSKLKKIFELFDIEGEYELAYTFRISE